MEGQIVLHGSEGVRFLQVTPPIVELRSDRRDMTYPKIVFVYPGWKVQWPNAETLSENDLEQAHSRFRRGIDIWILQSYVRLRRHLERAGFEVSVAEEVIRGSICIAHRDDLTNIRAPLHDCYLIGVRADRPRLRVAELEIVQNGLDLQPWSRFIPSWPQPGLVPRSAGRGSNVSRVAYMGRCESLPSWYTDGTLRDALADLQIELELRDDRWHDYSEVDVVLAHRHAPRVMLTQKPAAKLVNAWCAGTPAILGPEPANREFGLMQPFDYIETSDLRQTVTAVKTLRDVPALFNMMVRVGTERARQFRAESIRSQWLRLIIEEAVPGWDEWQRNRRSPARRYGDFVFEMAVQGWDTRVFRIKHAYQRRTLEYFDGRVKTDVGLGPSSTA